MIRVEGDRLYVSGAATLANAAQLIEESRALVASVRTVDFGEVTELDSSLLAVLIAWMRDAKAQGRALSFSRLPQDLRTLAQLYGVAQLLAPDAPST